MIRTVHLFGSPFECHFTCTKEDRNEWYIEVDAVYDGKIKLDLSAHGQRVEDIIIESIVQEIEDQGPDDY